MTRGVRGQTVCDHMIALWSYFIFLIRFRSDSMLSTAWSAYPLNFILEQCQSYRQCRLLTQMCVAHNFATVTIEVVFK